MMITGLVHLKTSLKTKKSNKLRLGLLSALLCCSLIVAGLAVATETKTEAKKESLKSKYEKILAPFFENIEKGQRLIEITKEDAVKSKEKASQTLNDLKASLKENAESFEKKIEEVVKRTSDRTQEEIEEIKSYWRNKFNYKRESINERIRRIELENQLNQGKNRQV
jgi:ElaB/YqjD/DUF883 family membrane-anchored ribosome-binding protein